jgi:hypothetical protein
MEIKQTQLLCTFSNTSFLQNDIDNILERYFIPNKQIYIFQEDVDNSNNLYLTYNAEVDRENREPHYNKTIAVHRKKVSNTFYTINALNELIKENNNGELDKNYEINWEEYKDTFILFGKESYKIVPVFFVKIKRF